jgi:hypothetical protein
VFQFVAAVALGLTVVPAARVAAEVFAVPEVVRQLHAPKEEWHVLRTPGGFVVGEQHFQAAVSGDRLAFDITTRLMSGEEWDEHGEMDLADGFRSRLFQKTMRRAGRVFAEQYVDFTTGKITWLVDGVQAERTMAFTPDTYIGPMMALVLAGVPDKSPARASFQALVFRPDPMVVTLRAEVLDQEDFTAGMRVEPATKVRVKADLGPIKNLMFASLIPTHDFWFTRESPPAFVAFEGALGNGIEVVMTPETPTTRTASSHAEPPTRER